MFVKNCSCSKDSLTTQINVFVHLRHIGQRPREWTVYWQCHRANILADQSCGSSHGQYGHRKHPIYEILITNPNHKVLLLQVQLDFVSSANQTDIDCSQQCSSHWHITCKRNSQDCWVEVFRPLWNSLGKINPMGSVFTCQLRYYFSFIRNSSFGHNQTEITAY